MVGNPSSSGSMEFYNDNTNLKWIILAVSVIISGGTILFTKILVDQLKEREKNQVQLFAKAIEYSNNDTENEILFITEEIIYKNNSIPTILLDEKNNITFYRNIDIDSSWSKEAQERVLKNELEAMKKQLTISVA